ncbi:helix-turn-helix domain-containing protein [Ruminococcus albus]|nr:helix-turn-helix transcriptional regulator [Ruminococcus albus]
MDNIVKLFGERVRSLRRYKKLSQERLAELAGVHTTYIRQIERA